MGASVSEGRSSPPRPGRTVVGRSSTWPHRRGWPCRQTLVVERLPDGRDPAVHHVRRRDDVRSGSCVGDRRACQQLDGRVVDDLPRPRRCRSDRVTCTRTGQTSVMTSRSDVASLMARVAAWTGASGSHAAEPVSSFWSGSPNRSTARSRRVRPLVLPPRPGRPRAGAPQASTAQRVARPLRGTRTGGRPAPTGSARSRVPGRAWRGFVGVAAGGGTGAGHERCSFPEDGRLVKYAAIASTSAGIV